MRLQSPRPRIIASCYMMKIPPCSRKVPFLQPITGKGIYFMKQFFLSEVLNNIQSMNREDKELRKTVVVVAEMYTICTTRISIYTVWVRVVRCQFSPLPTRSIGASGQWCLTSGFHFVVTFSQDDGLTTLKHIKKTSVCKEKKKMDVL